MKEKLKKHGFSWKKIEGVWVIYDKDDIVTTRDEALEYIRKREFTEKVLYSYRNRKFDIRMASLANLDSNLIGVLTLDDVKPTDKKCPHHDHNLVAACGSEMCPTKMGFQLIRLHLLGYKVFYDENMMAMMESL